MNVFIKNHRLNRCKTVQEIRVKNFTSRSVSTNLSNKTFKSGLELRIVTRHELNELRKQGRIVSVVRKLGSRPSFKRFTVPIAAAVSYPLQPAFVTLPGAPHVMNPPSAGRLMCCAQNDKPDKFPAHRPARGVPTRIRVSSRNPSVTDWDELKELTLVLARASADVARQTQYLCERVSALRLTNSGTPPPTGIFKKHVDEHELSVCFNLIFQNFFGPSPTERLMGTNNQPIDLIAFFFILIEWEKLGCDTFSDTCKKPFFNFAKASVIGDIGKTERTFHNRLTHTMYDFRNKLREETPPSTLKSERWKKYSFITGFQQVMKIFHETDFYKNLTMRRGA